MGKIEPRLRFTNTERIVSLDGTDPCKERTLRVFVRASGWRGHKETET